MGCSLPYPWHMPMVSEPVSRPSSQTLTFVSSNTLKSMCPALAFFGNWKFSISNLHEWNKSVTKAKNPNVSWILSFTSKHSIPSPTKSITRILSTFHVCSSLTFISYPSPLNSGPHHFLSRLLPYACHFPIYDQYCQKGNLFTIQI